MAWAKLDDSFWSHPKVLQAGNEAAGAYARMLSYCGRHLTDGRVADDVARFIARPKIIKVLVELDFIERNGTGYLIPDYLEFNPPAEKKLEEQAAARERMRKLRANAA